MKIEVTVKIQLELKEFEGSIEDKGLKEQLDNAYVQYHFEHDPYCFKSDDDVDIDIMPIDAEIIEVKKITMENIVERIGVLKKEITVRQDELDKLNKELMDSSDNFRDKFVIWANQGNHRQLDYLPQGDLRAYADECGWIEGRGVISMLDFEDFELYAHTNPESLFDEPVYAEKEIAKLEANSKFIAACAHMIKDNVSSFAIDW